MEEKEKNEVLYSIGLTTEIFGELKEQNRRLSEVLKVSIKAFCFTVALIVAGFLIYLYQYDFSGNVEQTGVYTLVDSQGNVISSDIDQEQLKEILNILNGDNKSNQKEN